MLISVSFLHIIPKSLEMDPRAAAYLLAAYLLMHPFNRSVGAYVRDKNPHYAI